MSASARLGRLGVLGLLAALPFAACGGLDSRDLYRVDGAASGTSGTAGSSGTGTSGSANNAGNGEGASDSGGAPAAGGEPGQPLGGETNTGAGGEGGVACEPGQSCEGAPLLEVEESRLSFGMVPTGVDSLPMTLHVKNSGDASTSSLRLALSGDQAQAFTASNDRCSGFSLAPGGTCTVDFTFKPTVLGANSASLDLSINPGNSATVALVGTGIKPSSVVFDPTSKVFALTAVNAVSGAQQFTVTNSGDTTAGNISAISLSNSTDFKISAAGNTCTGTTLNAGSSCSFSVTFEPKSKGQKTSTLELTTTSAPVAIVNLSGQCGNPAALAAPATFAFGDVPNGAATDKVISVGNSGDVATAMGVTANASGDYAVVGNTCTAPVAPGANVCAVTVRVTPGALGTRPGTLTLNAGNTNANVTLSAASKNPANVQISLASPGKGAVGAGFTKNFVYTVRNTGDLATGALNLTTTGNGHFVLASSNCNGVVLQPAQANSCTFTLRFEPDGPTGSVSHTATVAANPGGPKSVTATETGTAACTTIGSHTAPCTTNEWCTNFRGCSPRGVNSNTYCDSGKDYECLYGCDDEAFECCPGGAPCCPSGAQTPNVACP